MDRAEFEQLAMEHMDAVYRLALQLTRRPEEASDLVQDTYLKALRSSENFEERGKGMRAWLFTIAHHTFYTKMRRQARGPQAVPDIFDADEDATIPGEPPPVRDLRSLDWEYVDERLKAAIGELPPEQREILLLWGVEGLKYREIAAMMDVPIGTVMSRLHRARKTLGETLEEFASEQGFSSEQAEHRT
ncbi:MAG: sigma-70 family RNA polymerase sigma factor [Phycisphaerales bacterium]